MKAIFSLIKTGYYYLKSSYKIWRVRLLQEDDLIYTTETDIQICVYPGRKIESPYDFIVKFRERGKRERTLLMYTWL